MNFPGGSVLKKLSAKNLNSRDFLLLTIPWVDCTALLLLLPDLRAAALGPGQLGTGLREEGRAFPPGGPPLSVAAAAEEPARCTWCLCLQRACLCSPGHCRPPGTARYKRRGRRLHHLAGETSRPTPQRGTGTERRSTQALFCAVISQTLLLLFFSLVTT